MIGRLAGIALLLIVVAACGDEPGAVPDENATPTPELPAGDYIATQLPEPFSAGDQLLVSFTQDGVSFSATCNRMTGNAEVVDGVLHVSSVGGTEMGCPGAGHEQDEWLVDFFTGSPQLEHEDVGFTLTTDDVMLRFLDPDAVSDDVELEGTAWTLAGIEETDGDAIGLSVIPPPVDAGVRIEGGKLFVRTGCNRGSASVTVGEHRLELGPLALTKMACAGAAGDAERGVLQVLDRREVEWGITGTQLRLTYGDRALIFDAE